MPKPKKITYSGDSKIIKAIVNIGNWLLDNQYELPIASDEELGGIKVGNNLSIDENGVLSADATSIEELNDIGDVNISDVSVGQILKYGGTSVGWQNEDEYEYELPKASANTLGGIKVGSNLSIDNDGTLNATGGSSVSALDDLSDVDITTPTVGQILKYGGTSTGWVNDDESGGLTPVELTYAQYQALTSEQKNDPTKEYFVTDYPGSDIKVSDLSDTDISSPYEGQVLAYDETNEKWVNAQLDTGNLSDIYLSNLANNQILQYNLLTNDWRNVNANDLLTDNTYNLRSSITEFTGSIVCKQYANGMKYIKVTLSKVTDFVDAYLSTGIFLTYWPVNDVRVYAKDVNSGDVTDGYILFETDGKLSVEFFDTDSNSITFSAYYI